MYDGMFVSTTAGYTRYRSQKQRKKSQKISQGGSKPPFLELPAANPTATISVSAPYRKTKQNSDPSYFTLTAAVKVGDDDILTAVSGVDIRSDFFQKVLDEAVDQRENFCANHETSICALIDKNGYIIASNQGGEHTGGFVGEITGILMQQLATEDVGIFKRITIENTQAECEQKQEESSDASDLLRGPFSIISGGASSLLKTLGYYFTFFADSTLFPHSSVDAKQKKHSKVASEAPKVKVSCTMEIPFYVLLEERFEELRTDLHKEAKCESGCNMVYYLNKVKETNLLFLYAAVLDENCRRACFHSHDSLTHAQKPYSSICKMGQRYRRPPSSCFNQLVERDSIEVCGAGRVLTSSVWIMTSLLVVFRLVV